MILLDTNIVSELMKAAPSERVLAWLNDQDNEHLFISSITIAEISYGLRVLPDGKRRKLLEMRFEQFLNQAFAARVLEFDEAAAHIYGNIMGYRKEQGQPLSILDGQIAAIGLANNFAIATRNIKDFTNLAIELINPFVAEAAKI
jgi:toxin FitB